jgi:hypothetical protein
MWKRFNLKLLVAVLMPLLVMSVVSTVPASADEPDPEIEFTESLAPEPPSLAEIDKVEIAGVRGFDTYTTDSGTAGGRLYGSLTWYGRAPYYGQVTGTVVDRDADGYCAMAEVSLDGTRFSLYSQRACPEGDTTSFEFRYALTYVAKVRVCRVKDRLVSSCSAWR